MRAWLAAWRAGRLPYADSAAATGVSAIAGTGGGEVPRSAAPPPFRQRHAETLRYALPAYVGLVVIVLVTQLWLGNTLANFCLLEHADRAVELPRILALGQGTVILTGGLDLSVPWTISLQRHLLAGIVQGSDAALVYALPLVLAIACPIGWSTASASSVLGLSPIVVTLGDERHSCREPRCIYSNGTPAGFSSPLLRAFMTSHVLGTRPVVFFVAAFVVFAVYFLSRTAFGRRVYGIGNGLRVGAAFRHRRRAHADRRLHRSRRSARRSSGSC